MLRLRNLRSLSFFSLSLSLLSLSLLSFLSLSLSPSPPLSFPLSLSPPTPCTPPSSSSLLLCLSLSSLLSLFVLSVRFLAGLVGVSRVVSGVRAAQCQLRRELGVSRVLRSHRVVRSLASSHRLSSRVVCRLAVRRPAARCQSHRVRSRVGVGRVSSCVVPLVGVSRVVC